MTMGLLKLRWTVVWIIAVFQVASTLAYPNGAWFVTEESDSSELDRRAGTVPGSITIDLFKELDHATWTGYEVRPGLGGSTLSDQVVRNTAYLTYESIKSKLPSPGLVSIVYVPGGGWAAGTVWQGSNEGFDRFAARADVFWHSLSVPDQGIRPGSGGVHQWHAEAVAVAKSELEFGDSRADKFFIVSSHCRSKISPKAPEKRHHFSVLTLSVCLKFRKVHGRRSLSA
jgi:hypothetical protein